MDIQILFIVFVIYFVEFTTQNRKDDMWEELSLKFGVWKKLPRTALDAAYLNYTRANDICQTNRYHGFLYRKKGDTKAIPIYDLDGRIAGIQAMIPGYMKGFNYRNETISLPPNEIMPPVLYGYDPNGPAGKFFTITAYFKHPKLVCNPIAKHNIQTGRGLYIQTGDDPTEHHFTIPLESKGLGPQWVQSTCMPRMGTHYFFNLTKDLHCERIYPVFLMYDIEGKLAAFGWSFQGFPLDLSESDLSWFKLTPALYQFLFDISKLPPCMFNKDFKIFGIHIWLKDPDSETLRCKLIHKPAGESSTIKIPPNRTYRTKYGGQNSPVITDTNRNNYSHRNRFSYYLIVLTFLCSLFSRHIIRL